MKDLDDKIDALVEERFMSKIEEIINLSSKLGDLISEHIEKTVGEKLDVVMQGLEKKIEKVTEYDEE